MRNIQQQQHFVRLYTDLKHPYKDLHREHD